MTGLLVLWLLAAGPAGDTPAALPAPRLGTHSSTPATPGRGTRCGGCHSVGGWTKVVFPHDRTGFPLKGLHNQVTCSACHPVDFIQQVPQACSGCHRDVHSGSLGARCESCHEESTWKTTFTVDAHRMTNFPLTGRHALLPCESCHPDARARAFSRQTVECASCHMADYVNAAAMGINHDTLGFGPNCRQCHDGTRFTGARFAQHEDCFQIAGGAHGGIECLQCHTRIIPNGGACDLGSPGIDCTTCHDHERTKTDTQHHVGVLPCVTFADHVHQICQYSYQGQLCYPCHQFR